MEKPTSKLKKKTLISVTVDSPLMAKVENICKSHMRTKSDTVNWILALGMREFEKGNITV